MGLTYNGTEVQGVTYNGAEVQQITYNGVEVWRKASRTLNDNDWSTIREIAMQGMAGNYWSVGDTKDIVINGTFGDITLTNFAAKAVIIGINHNASVEGNNKIHFAVMKKSPDIGICFFPAKMNDTQTNIGGWNACKMRTTILPAFKNALPSDLKNVIGTVKKWTDNNGGGKPTVSETTDSMFIPSFHEVSGSDGTGIAYKQMQYDYWKNGGSTKLTIHTWTSGSRNWWTRTTVPTRSDCFYCQNSYVDAAQAEEGMVPCFVIG